MLIVRKISSLAAVVAVTFLFAATATADTAAQQPISGDSGSAAEVADTGDQTKRKKKRKKKAKKICTRETVTGTHFRKRICRTQAQIDARKEADQRLLNDLVTSGGAPQGGA